MLRPALLAVLLVGCAKKPAPDPDAPPPDAEFTLKVVDEQPGQKVAVVRTRSGANTMTAGATTQTQKSERRAEYVETVHEVAPDAGRPTRVTREYTTALASDPKGELKPLSYSGKTVEIRKAGPKAGYTFTVAGKPLPAAEAAEIAKDFAGPGWFRAESLLPKTPVKVGDEWRADAGGVGSLGDNLAAELQSTLDREKTAFTGKLVRVYQKDGRQWGVMEFRLRVAFAPAGDKAAGAITANATLDAPIDGSVRAGTLKWTLKGDLTGKDPKLGDVRLVLDGAQEQTVTPAS